MRNDVSAFFMHLLPLCAFNGSSRWSLYLFNARFFKNTLLLSFNIHTKNKTEHETFWEGQINKLVKNNLSFLFNLMLDNIDSAQGVYECQ